MRYEVERLQTLAKKDQSIRVRVRNQIMRILLMNKVLMMDSRMLEKIFAKRVNIGRRSSKMTIMSSIRLENWRIKLSKVWKQDKRRSKRHLVKVKVWIITKEMLILRNIQLIRESLWRKWATEWSKALSRQLNKRNRKPMRERLRHNNKHRCSGILHFSISRLLKTKRKSSITRSCFSWGL